MDRVAGPEISFRRLVEDDLTLMHRWLNEPGVVRWWEGNGVSWDAVVVDYGPESEPAFEHWLASIAGTGPLGWIQCYCVADSPEEFEAWSPFGIGDRSGGIDYLVGDPGARGRGMGTEMIRAFVHDVVFPQHPEWLQVCASPYVMNSASWRALSRAGFEHLGDFDDDDGACRLMALQRPLPPARRQGATE